MGFYVVLANLASELPQTTGDEDRGRGRGTRTGDDMLLHTDPIGCSNLHDQLNGVFHKKPSISSHHQRGSLTLGRLDDGNNALNEVLGVVLVLLEHRHPLPQPACPGLLVRVRICLDRRYFHHV